jgi:hypothetical protein
MSRSQWGGQRSNQRGRPPLPEHKKRVRVANWDCQAGDMQLIWH